MAVSSGSNKNLITGSGGGKAPSSGAPVEGPDTLRSTAYARILDLVSEGEIVGLVNGLESVFLDQTPLMNSDGSFNFRDVTVDSRTGTQDQDHISNFPEVESETAVGLELTNNGPGLTVDFTRSFTNLSLSAVRIRLAVPALTKVDKKTGNTGGHNIAYKIELATNGGAFEVVFNGAFRGKTNQNFERSHRIDLPPTTGSGWVLRIQRITPNENSQFTQDTMLVQSVAEIVDVKLRMPNSALVGVIVDASQFQNIPTRAYHMKGRIIRVPSNYNPVTRVYTGVWNGTFQLAYSNNPAWVFFDLITHPVYGLGNLLDEALVDKWALFNIGQYADEMVDDGVGGLEPRFVANIYLQTATEAFKVIQDLASLFRGIAYWAGGQIVAVADKPEDPVYSYSNSNVLQGEFTYSGSSRRARHTVALVSWSDIKRFGSPQIHYVADQEGIARYGVQVIEVTSIGGISLGAAERMGRWILLSEKLETNTISFETGMDGAITAPGKIIKVFDSNRTGSRRSGRIAAATSSSVTIDSMPIPAVVIGNTLTVTLPSGITAKSTVSDVTGNVITVTPTFPGVPIVDAIWAVEDAQVVGQLFRVLEVEEKDFNRYQITALEHNASKFAAGDFGLDVQVPLTSFLPSTSIQPPATVTVQDFVKLADGQAINVLETHWEPVANAIFYTVQWRRGDDDWTPPRVVEGLTVDFENVYPGIWSAKVWATSATGISSLPRTSELFEVGQPEFPVVEIPIIYDDPPANTVGSIIINGLVSEQYSLLLDAQVTAVEFQDIPIDKILIIFIVQGGQFTINWPSNVVFESGEPYVPTQVFGRIDAIGLSTSNGGVDWLLRSSIDVQEIGDSTTPGSGNPLPPSGPPPAPTVIELSDITGECSAAGSIPCIPAATANVTITGGSPPFIIGWTFISGDTMIIDDSTSLNPTFSAPATGITALDLNARFRLTTVDAGNIVNTAHMNVRLIRKANNLTITGGGVAGGFCLAFLPSPCIPSTSAGAGVVDGAPPYVVEWSFVSGSRAITIDNPNAIDPTFSGPLGKFTASWSATWKVKVTDASAAFRERLWTINLNRETDQ